MEILQHFANNKLGLIGNIKIKANPMFHQYRPNAANDGFYLSCLVLTC